MLNVAQDVGRGPVLLLIHGVASSSVTFDPVVPLISDHHRCISIDLLGFGGSPAPVGARYTIEEHVAAIHATVRSLRLTEPFGLIGHSLGALLAARYAASHPEMVSRVVLVNPPVYLRPTQLSDLKARAEVSRHLRAYEYLRNHKTFTLRNAARLARILRVPSVFDVSNSNWDAVVQSLKNCVESQTALADIAELDVRVEVVYGAFDEFVARRIIGILSRFRRVTTHRLGLTAHLVNPRMAKAIARAVG